MFTQGIYLREAVTMTRNSTLKLDLPGEGQLSALLLKITGNCTSGATLTATPWRIQDHISNILVLANGATPIKSYSAPLAQYTAWLSQGLVPPHFWRNYAENTQMEYLWVLFGRRIGDEQYGLDLEAFSSMELQITNTATSTYYSTDFTVSVLQAFMRDMPGKFGSHIRTLNWREWTTVSDETKYYLLPSEFPLRGIHLRALPDETSGVNDCNCANLMDDIDFSLNGGTKQVYKGGLDDLMVLRYMERGAEIHTHGLIDRTADYGLDFSVGRAWGRSIGSGSKDDAVSSVIPTIESDQTDGSIKPEAREADSPIEIGVTGMAYQYTVPLLHVPDCEADKMIQPITKDGEVRLNLHTRSGAAYADGTNTVMLEQVAPNG